MADVADQGIVAHNILIRPVGHVAATGAIVISWFDALGPVLSGIATIMAILWYGVTLYESKTVQDLILRFKARAALKLHNAAVAVATKTVEQAQAAVVAGKDSVAAAKDTVTVVKDAAAAIDPSKS